MEEEKEVKSGLGDKENSVSGNTVDRLENLRELIEKNQDPISDSKSAKRGEKYE